MNISVILAHPHKGSLNHAIADAAVRRLEEDGHRVIFHDLYAEGFDPVLPYEEIHRGAPLPPLIARHCGEIAAADGIVVVHPNWWGQPPAILKGWIDRVLRPGVAYRFLEGDMGEGVPDGLLAAKTALVFTTSNTPLEREMAVFGDPLEALWNRCIFPFCGIQDCRRRNFGVVATSTDGERKRWLEEVRDMVHGAFPGP
ncbi:MAG: NAD(P)H-dependent oxidoreductase [Methanomicrobiaceae archaeon]|nr:NAD(P)H-dependent oxidoreductase [Methanomicrobiaceae archaeon]